MNLKEKYAGMSFADVSKKISDKYKNRDNDAIQMRSFMQEMEDLKKLQEAYKTAKEVKDAFTKVDLKGTTEVNNNLPQAFNGLDLSKLKLPAAPIIPLGSELNETVLRSTTTPNKFTTTLPNASYSQNQAGSYALTQQPTMIEEMKVNAADLAKRNKPYDEMIKRQQEYEPTTTSLPSKSYDNQITQQNPNKPELEITTLKNPKKKSKLEEFFENPNSAWILGRGAEALGKGIMLATGRETYNAITNPYQQEALDLIRNQRINSQAVKNEILAQQEAALQNLANVRSTAVQQAGKQNIYGQTADQMARAELQEQGLRNELSGRMASALTQLGGQQMGAEERARQLNIASQQTQQQSIQNMIESIGATGQEISEFRQGIASNEFVFKLLATGNFEIDAKCMKDLQLGKSIETACIKSKASGKESPQDITNVNRNTDLANNTASTTNTKTTG